jgi:hypothetical protein
MASFDTAHREESTRQFMAAEREALTAMLAVRANAAIEVIRLQRIYNFLCSMLVFTPFAYCFVTLRGTFMHFPELTY